MEKPNQERQSLELDDSSGVEVAKEIVDDEPQNQENSENRMQDESVGLADNTNPKSGQPDVLQCEESMQSGPEELTGTIGMEHDTVAGECQKLGTVQATAKMTVDAETEKVSKPSRTIECTLSIAQIVEEVMPPEHPESPEVAKESEGNEEISEQVRLVEQAMEFVLEEAVICDARQEQMEEAEDIEEPQKYAFREKDKE